MTGINGEIGGESAQRLQRVHQTVDISSVKIKSAVASTGKNKISNKGKVRNLKQFSEVINFLEQQNIRTLDDLESRVNAIREEFHTLTDSLQAKSKRMDELKKLIQNAEDYRQLKPVFDEMNQIHWKGRREKFAPWLLASFSV